MKDTLVSKYGTDIKAISIPDIPNNFYKAKLKTIQTYSIRNSINSMNNNKVLNSVPNCSLFERLKIFNIKIKCNFWRSQLIKKIRNKQNPK